MSCALKVSLARTADHRSICGRGGRLCNVSGVLVICSSHRRQLRRMGLTVEPVFSLAIEREQSGRSKRRRKPVESAV
jgi:hypothetical protein